MTKPPEGFARDPLADGDYPPDLYDPDEIIGTPLVTLPMNSEEVPSGTSSSQAGEQGFGGWDPSRPIGPGNPPRKHTFAKGKSGNPKGPRCKSPDGPVTKLMNQTLTALDGEKKVLITKREKLDRLVAFDACRSTKGLKLFQQRTERAEKIEQQRQIYEHMLEERQRKRKTDPTATAQRLYELQCVAHEALYQAIQIMHPSFFDALTELQNLDAIDFIDGQYVLKEAVQRHL